ncbi:hypothetical protein SynMVIR181_02431 [Synechococcus sp. MVIR-18-1]|nr:hypothetical protein SynMVIR181_02431 [Synechococcus sp. MVIR-18-1]
MDQIPPFVRSDWIITARSTARISLYQLLSKCFNFAHRIMNPLLYKNMTSVSINLVNPDTRQRIKKHASSLLPFHWSSFRSYYYAVTLTIPAGSHTSYQSRALPRLI